MIHGRRPRIHNMFVVCQWYAVGCDVTKCLWASEFALPRALLSVRGAACMTRLTILLVLFPPAMCTLMSRVSGGR